MKKILIHGAQECLVDDEDYEYLSKFRWYSLRGYAVRKPGAKVDGKRPWIRMHRELLWISGGSLEVDHIDGNRLNNRRENLRVANRTQNMANQGRRKTNSSGYKGVSFHAASKKWQAAISYKGKSKYLGIFDCPEQTHEFYCLAADLIHGDFANHG